MSESLILMLFSFSSFALSNFSVIALFYLLVLHFVIFDYYHLEAWFCFFLMRVRKKVDPDWGWGGKNWEE